MGVAIFRKSLQKKGDSYASYTTIHPSLHVSRHYFPHKTFADRIFAIFYVFAQKHSIMLVHDKPTMGVAAHTKRSTASLEAHTREVKRHSE